jgi:hypothetical protein
VPEAVGVADALMTEVLPRTDVGAASGLRVDVKVSSGAMAPSVCRMLVTAPLVAASVGVETMAAGLNSVKVGTTTETMAQEDEEEDAPSTEDGAGMIVVQPETFFAPLVRVTVEEIMTTVCKVEIEETTTSVIEGTTVMEVLIMMDGEEVIVVARTLDIEAVVVIVNP